MTGGTLETKGLTMGKNNVLDTANFNLDGGTLSVIGGFSGAVNLKSNSKLAISDGVFQWEGDRTNAIDSMITSGNITFATTTVSDDYSGITPEQSWTSTDGTTTLYADYNEVRTTTPLCGPHPTMLMVMALPMVSKPTLASSCLLQTLVQILTILILMMMA